MIRSYHCALTSLVLVLICPWTADAATLDIVGPTGATLFVDGNSVGEIPLGQPLQVGEGGHDVRLEAKGYKPWKQRLSVSDVNKDYVQIVRMDPLSRGSNFVRSVFLLGLAQHYQGRHLDGWMFLTAEVAGLGAALYGQYLYSNAQDDLAAAQDQFVSSVDPDEINAARNAAYKATIDQDFGNDMRKLGLAFFGVAATWSLLDAWFRFPSIQAGSGLAPRAALSPEADRAMARFEPVTDPTSLHMGVTFGF